MSLFSKFFGKPKEAPLAEVSAPGDQEALVPVPIPALGVLLLHLEKRKGSPLSEAEVLEARDKAACIMLPVTAKRAMDEKRGYEDINPENAWSEWQVFRAAGLARDG
jgi:hypothetical protein